jgi:hypothetical protein
MKMVKATWMAALLQPCAVGERIDEQGPAVLQVGDHGHADDAHDQLHPAEGRWPFSCECLGFHAMSPFALIVLCARTYWCDCQTRASSLAGGSAA